MNKLSVLGSALLISCWSLPASAQDVVYEGIWQTTNRKLDGQMTCAVTDLGEGHWQGRFRGVWQGVPFDYKVKFQGTPENLRGRAVIDGADYTWRGEFSQETPGSFKGTFGGNRYEGYFALQESKRLK